MKKKILAGLKNLGNAAAELIGRILYQGPK
jgi:hypothetical protein